MKWSDKDGFAGTVKIVDGKKYWINIRNGSYYLIDDQNTNRIILYHDKIIGGIGTPLHDDKNTYVFRHLSDNSFMFKIEDV